MANEADRCDGPFGQVAVHEDELDEPGDEGLKDDGHGRVAGEGGRQVEEEDRFAGGGG